jgi:hypothetical protein
MDCTAFASSGFLLGKNGTSATFYARSAANSGLERHSPLFFYETQINHLTDGAD